MLAPGIGLESQMLQVADKLRDQLTAKRKELADFQTKYKIRIRTEADLAEEQQQQQQASEGSKKTQGVLA